ncbi:hypothetical protein PENANT_c010G00273 [Penicillium antarcticum]|uniref:Uncharacterized protein n=1 Tax=Penicillium antarcticum TaxID=416450 RepID=A0A1V6Q8W4_9EURO|nr:uncharacterized protein N7508_000634 [Penicillium antarcticum]KAJ5320351.1 hypothetical protein N7508_000634 [Penicillium antarcticum]OQD85432.1 hypothetical protein PENANT_c010G00273 [Penicillium antarcticum]
MANSNMNKSPEDLKRLERLKALQMADLGTFRREVITTHDITRNRGPPRGQSGVDRECDKPGTFTYQLAQANKNNLSAWSNYHTTVTDTDSMEELDDINDGQSHRRALHDHFAGRRRPMPQLSDLHSNSPRPIKNHPASAISLGRGGGRAGTNRRGSYDPSPLKSRTSQYGGIVKTNNNHRSVSMTVGSRLDPALSINNNDIEPHAHGRGCGQSRGVDRGRVRAIPRQCPMPRRSSRPQRPIPDMSSALSDSKSFLSIMEARTVAMPKLPAAMTLSTPVETTSHEQPLPFVMSSLSTTKARRVTMPEPPTSFPVPPHMKAHYKDQPLAERMTPKTPTLSRTVPRPQTAAVSKSKDPVQTSKNTAKSPIGETGTSTHVEDLKWKITADEYPRKKGALSLVSAAVKKAPSATRPPQITKDVQKLPSGEAQAAKHRASGQDLHEGPVMTKTSTQTDSVPSYTPDNDLINLEWTTPPGQASFTSPNAAVLQGLDMVALVLSAPSVSSIDVSADAESQRSELGFHDLISTRGKSEQEFIDIVSKAVNKSVRSAINDYTKDHNVPYLPTSSHSEAPTIAQDLGTDSSQKLLTGISTPTRDMSHLEMWLSKANDAAEGSSFEKHRSPHGSSPGSVDQKQSTRIPVPGLSPHKSEYSEMDVQPIAFTKLVEMMRPREFTNSFEQNMPRESAKIELTRRLDPFNPIESTKRVEVLKSLQTPAPVTSRSSGVSTKLTGLLSSRYASEPPVTLAKPAKKKPFFAAAKSIPHDITSKVASRTQRAPSRPPGLGAPFRPPGLPLQSEAMASRPRPSARVPSESTSNVTQPVISTGVRTIGPVPSVFEPTTFRNGHGATTPPISSQQPVARMPLRAENWSANITPGSSNSNALNRLSNLTFSREQLLSPAAPRIIGPGPGPMLPGFSPTPVAKSADKAVRKVSTLGPAPFTPRK